MILFHLVRIFILIFKFVVGDHHFWVSASDVGQTPGHIHWADGSLVEHSMWRAGEPNQFGRGTESCVVFDSQHKLLLDEHCTDRKYVMCEVPEVESC